MTRMTVIICRLRDEETAVSSVGAGTTEIDALESAIDYHETPEAMLRGRLAKGEANATYDRRQVGTAEPRRRVR